MIRITLALFLFITLSSVASPLKAEAKFPSGKGEIVPGVKVLDEEQQAYALSLITTFQLLTKQPIHSFDDDTDIEKINFFYASGEGYIVNQRVSISALPLFGKETQAKISKLSTNSEVCYVQDFSFQDGRQITVAIHNEDNDFSEDIFRCLIAGLWNYSFGNFDEVDGINWRNSFQKLLRLDGS